MDRHPDNRIFDETAANRSNKVGQVDTEELPAKRIRRSVTDNSTQIPYKISVIMTPEELKAACTELVTVNGRPFSIVEDSGFRKIIDPILDGMEMKPIISAETMKAHVSVIAESIRNKIKAELKEKVVSLKLDTVTRYGKTMVGIHVQLIDGNSMVLRTLLMKEMKDKNCLSYTAPLIGAILQEYDIKSYQLFNVTTDNGINILKTPMDETEEQNTNGEDAAEINADVMEVSYPNEMFTNAILWTRCTAHIIQFAIEDALKGEPIATLIAKARQACQKLVPKQKAVLKPIIGDCETRWFRIHEMLQKLLFFKNKYKERLEQITELYLPDSDWDVINDIVNGLKPVRNAIKILQEEHMIAGDFYKTWLNCKLATEKIKTQFTKTLLQFMNERETRLFNNKAFLGAIFLDPRFKVILNQNQIETAMNYINSVWKLLQMAKRGENVVDIKLEPENESLPDDEIETLLKEKEKAKRISGTSADITLDLLPLLKSYYEEPREKHDTSVLNYWHKKMSSVELQAVAKSILSLQPTQVSVERVFSSLNFIRSPEGANLDGQFLQDMLLIKMNEIKDYNLLVSNWS